VKKLKETDISTHILECLDGLRIGVFWRNNNVGVFDSKKMCYRKPPAFSRKGIADILGCLKGVFVSIEVKSAIEYKWAMAFYKRVGDPYTYVPQSEKEKHVLNQIIFMLDIINHGGVAFFTYSVGDALNKLGVINNYQPTKQEKLL